MGSGQKNLVINTRERAISNDITRAQAFLGKQSADFARWLYAFLALQGGSGSAPSSASSTAGWIVLNGLLVRPEIGTDNLFISAGMVALTDPDSPASADDSPLKLIYSDGVDTAGDLTLTPGGGGTRIDVVEFQRLADDVDETQSRDIYDTTTGAFTAANVTKVSSDKLTFRIRTGTPGAGWPGTASGWFPIAVVSVPNAATTWNDVIVWDVRPLVQDLVRHTPMVTNFPFLEKAYGSFYFDGVSERALSGVFETQLKHWRCGGEVGSTLSGLTSGRLILDGGDVIENGFTPGASPALRYVYAAFPFSLPRWARLSPSSSGFRIPLPFNGIPIFTDQVSTFQGFPTSALSLPADLGFVSTTSTAKVIATSRGAVSTGELVSTVIADRWTYLANVNLIAGTGPSVNPTAGNNSVAPRYDLTENVHFPRGATMIRVLIKTTLAGGAPNTIFDLYRSVLIEDAGTVIQAWGYQDIVGKNTLTADSTPDGFIADIPIHALTNMPSGTSASVYRILVGYLTNNGATPTYSDQTLSVVGWRMGA